MEKCVLKGFVALAFAAGVCAGTASGITLENGEISIAFGSEGSGFGIGRIVNRLVPGTAFGGDAEKGGFWKLRFTRDAAAAPELKGEVWLASSDSCRARRIERMADGGAVFVWEGMDLPGSPAAVSVRARVRFDADGSTRWSLDVRNQSAGYGLAATQYPVIRDVVENGAADQLQPRPDLGAKLVRGLVFGKRPQRFGCMSYHPMMTAFLRGGGGLYFAAHDSQARIKTLVVTPDRELRFETPVENAGLAGLAAEGPRYEVTLRTFRGDWWRAAAFYRAWALTAPWTAKGPILSRADYPRRICEIPIWLNTHALPAEVSNTMARARATFPRTDTGLHWHVWQHSKHDINYPEYFPAQEGVEDCFAFCRSIGAEAMPYINGRLWSTNLISFPLVSRSALHRENGMPYVEHYGPRTPPFSPMCPYTRAWDDTLNLISARILDLGAKSLFLDQIGACSGAPCFARDHGHPIGGGSWFYEGYQRILAKTHARYSARGAFLTTEGSGEEWMNVIDGYLCVTQRSPEDVPFWHAVYNGYTTYFCSPENQDDDIASFRAAQTRELLWGQALGWYHPLILEKPDKCALLNRLAAFRQAHLDTLAYGTLEGEIAFADPVPRVKLTWLGRKPFWAWAYPDYPLSRTVTGEMPSVFGYRWRSGVTGRACAFLANVGEAPCTVRFSYGGSERSRTLAAGEIAVVE